jgi:hypothetical protein
MIEKTMLRLIIAMGVPLGSALVLEQLPKTGVAEVPFAFQVEEKTLPPGTYSIRQSDVCRGIRIQNEKVAAAGTKCVAAEHRFGKAQGARLVFDNYEGHYLLSEIWFDADGRGLILQQKHLSAKAGSDGENRDVQFVRFQ